MVQRARAPRRATEWFTTEQNTFIDLAAGAQVGLALFSAVSAGARFIKGTTVTRMIIAIDMRPNVTAQDNYCSWGITTVNQDAATANAYPEADDTSDRAGWMVRGNEYVGANSLFDGAQFAKVRLDIRSQRVLRDEEQTLQLILDNNGNNVVEWRAYIRCLMKWA